MDSYVAQKRSSTFHSRTCLLVREHRPSSLLIILTLRPNIHQDHGILTSSLLSYHLAFLDSLSLKWCSNVTSNSLYQTLTAFAVLSTIPQSLTSFCPPAFLFTLPNGLFSRPALTAFTTIALFVRSWPTQHTHDLPLKPRIPFRWLTLRKAPSELKKPASGIKRCTCPFLSIELNPPSTVPLCSTR